MIYHIRPCPECSVVPEKVMMGAPERFVAVKPTCGHVYQDGIVSAISWNAHCVRMMHDALDATGIVTIAELTERLAPDPRLAVLEKKLAKLTDKLAMVEQESEQRLSAIIGYSDQLLAMKEKYEPVPQSGPHPDGCFSSDPNDVTDCESDGHYSCKDCKRNSRIAAQRGEVEK